jgi:hypothetical protein
MANSYNSRTVIHTLRFLRPDGRPAAAYDMHGVARAASLSQVDPATVAGRLGSTVGQETPNRKYARIGNRAK